MKRSRRAVLAAQHPSSAVPHSARPVVALVGRPNVGKSTIFNRLIGHQVAIVQDLPGLTRDRHYSEVTLGGVPIWLVDTGGFEPKTSDDMLMAMRAQTELAIEEADVVVLVADGRVGYRPEDGEIARLLRKAGKKVVACINKIDREEVPIFEFLKLGIEPMIAVSAEHGRGTRDLVDAIKTLLPESVAVEPDAPAVEVLCDVAIIGRPNVGKSSLINSILGEDRHLATPIAGTTRDSVDSLVERNGEIFRLVDTAGLRRKARVSDRLEEYMVVSALRTIDRADVVVLVLDATELGTDQESKIAALCHERGKGIILAVNKWDLPHERLDPKSLRPELERHFPFLSYARNVYMSAKTGQGVEQLFDEIKAVLGERRKRIPTGELNRFFERTLESHPPPFTKGKRAKLYFATQIATEPPTFVAQVNDPDRMSPAYKRYLINALRAEFGFAGVPLELRFTMRSQRGAREPKDV